VCWFGTSYNVTDAVMAPLVHTSRRMPPVSSAQSLAEAKPGAVIENNPMMVPEMSEFLPPSTRCANAVVPHSHFARRERVARVGTDP
jgi:hypothetical protein